MKTTQKDFANVAQRAVGSCTLWFLCGPDEAGAELAVSRVLAMLPDPGERVDLSGAELKADSARLIDEARSSSLFGGARHILARVNGEDALKAVEAFVELADLGETDGACPVFIMATGATDKSRTAKLLVDRKDALVAMFHPPGIEDVKREVRAMAGAAGLRDCGSDLVERLALATNLDLRLARTEIDKLALYLDASPQSPKQPTLAHFDAIGACTDEDNVPPIVSVVLSGDLARLPEQLARVRDLGINPVQIVLALERRAAQLSSLAARLAPRENIKQFLQRERVFFRDVNELEIQLGRWPGPKLDRLVTRLTALHQSLLGNSQSADLLLSQALVQIARFAATRSR